MIRGENSFLVGFVLLDKMPGFAEVTVVEDAKAYLDEKIAILEPEEIIKREK
jgi:Cu(I)/Ag(I) efflux system membrane protein CusA/SilA